MGNLVKGLAIVGVMVAAAFFCCGMFKDNTPCQKHVVKPGETLNGIADMYYEKNAKGVMAMTEYQMMVRVRNNKLHNLERQLQIDDPVMVPIYVEKK